MKIFGSHDEKTLAQLRDVSSSAERVALMADGHLGYIMPIGGVAAYDNMVSVTGVGFDISCLDGDTEFLSPKGWRRIAEWSGEDVLQYDKHDGSASFVQPLRYIEKQADMFYHFLGDTFDQKVTPDHNMLMWYGYKKRGYNIRDISAKDLVDKHHSLTKGVQAGFCTVFTINDSTLSLSNEEIRVQAMVSADGCLRPKKTKENMVEVHVKKERKIQRVQDLLQQAGISYSMYSEESGAVSFTFIPPMYTKDLTFLYQASTEQLRVVAEECLLWDGHKGKHEYFSTTEKKNAEAVQFAFSASGYRANIYSPSNTLSGRKQAYVVYKTKNNIVGLTKDCVQEVPGGTAYCFTVPTGYFIARRNGRIFVTGNCGNAAIMTDLRVEDVFGFTLAEFKRNPSKNWMNPRNNELADDIYNALSFGIGRKNAAEDAPVDHELFHDPAWFILPNIGPLNSFRDDLMEKAREQLGTIGSGNHYVDVFSDEEGFIWVGVHFGSRGFGHTVASSFLALSQGKEWGDTVKESEALLSLDSELGKEYWELMTLAGKYAYVGREWVARKVVSILGGKELDLVHNNHNFAWKEQQLDKNGEVRELVVVRKGATPAFNGVKSFVGGSMGDESVILVGRASNMSAEALHSTVHGAGRVMSRTQAGGKYKGWGNKRRQVKRGEISPEMMRKWVVEDRGVILRGGGLDESPHAYRRLPDVLAEQGDTVSVVTTLTPLIVCMAGEGEYDPFKD